AVVYNIDYTGLDEQTMAASAAKARLVPRIQHLTLGESHKALPDVRHPMAIGARLAVRHDDTAHPDPVAMLAAAGEREAAAHPVAPGHPQGLAGRGGRGRGPGLEVGIHGPPHFVVQERRDI